MPPVLISPWTRCQYCRGSFFRLDLSFQQGQFMRYVCKSCQRELHIQPDLKLTPSLAGGTHAHIDWVILPVIEDRLNPRTSLAQMTGFAAQFKTLLDNSTLTLHEQIGLLQSLVRELNNEIDEDTDTVEMKTDDVSTKH